MDFRILGPLEVEGSDGGLVDLGHAKQRTVLGVLLLRRNAVVSRERLIDELWGETVPPTATKLVQLYVSHLRKRLRQAGIDDFLRTQPPGYVAALDAESLDAARFERLVGRARTLRERGGVEGAVHAYRKALALWRGPALADLSFESYASNEVERLNEARLAALTERIGCELSLGREAQLVGELEALVAEQPLREGLREQLMLALYRSGRQAEALDVYHDARRTLRDELGLEPSPRLRKLEQAILRQDTSLVETAPAAVSESPPSPAAASKSSPARPFSAAPPEVRKIVTVLFSDLVASTRLGQQLDPEALRRLMLRYFEEMRVVLERHGGTVEKCVGDAVMAVFGVPVLHEDDAVRAVRAAAEMREQLAALNEELMGVWGVRLAVRIGVDTGEVIAGDPSQGHLFVTGEAVNTAKRLEELAGPTEVLIGEETFALVRDALEAEAVEPLELKGRREPVHAYRVVSVHEAPERRHEIPFVGRVEELETLRQAWQQVCDEQRCQLVTVVGDAGVGKSRLTAEFLSSVEAECAGGRCLPYGEGITYSPAVEVMRELDALPSDPAAAASLRSLLGASDEATSAEEIAWAFRKLLEEQAPLVCLFDDVQWGEETFLDLVEHVALLSTGAPILLLCLARRELAERRPEWPVALRLEPLPEPDVNELIPETLAADLRERIARASGGNPLFVTQMVAMAEENEGEVAVPSTLRALLAARLDQLESVERSLLERGAIEGEVFHRSAVQALSDSRHVTPPLASLVRKGLIRPDKAQLPGEDAFRFRHLLIRDTAYDALPKAARAELHERVAAWLEEKGEDVVELDELLGFHLEQAARYKAELGRPVPGLAQRASEHLAAAGRRALWRGDSRAAAPLLERALALTRPLRLDVHLELDFAEAQQAPREQAAIAEQAAERASEAGDAVGEALALVVAADARSQFADDPAVDELERLVRAALPLLEQAEDNTGLGWVWFALGDVVATRGRFEEWAQAAERALRHLRLAGRHPFGHPGLQHALALGPRPADEALRTLDSVLPANSQHPWVLLRRAGLLAMLGRFEEAWALALPAAERARELGGEARGESHLAEIATLAGDHATATGYLRRYCDMLERRGMRTFLSTAAPQLGRSLCALGRYDEAEPLARLGRELGGEQDFVTQMLWRQVQALVDADRGEYGEAERIAREAVAIAERTDGLNFQGDALCDLAKVLAAAGRGDEVGAALEQALDRYERKRNLPMVSQVHKQLDALHKAAPA